MWLLSLPVWNISVPCTSPSISLAYYLSFFFISSIQKQTTLHPTGCKHLKNSNLLRIMMKQNQTNEINTQVLWDLIWVIKKLLFINTGVFNKLSVNLLLQIKYLFTRQDNKQKTTEFVHTIVESYFPLCCSFNIFWDFFSWSKIMHNQLQKKN